MNIKRILKKLIKHSLKKALLVTLIFALFYQFSNTEFVRNKVEDIGFDILNKFLFSTRTEKPPLAPKVLLFGFDDEYMVQNNLFDEDNRTNYGYHFPRSHIVKFINYLDKTCFILKNYKQLPPPKALFLDIDTSFALLKPDGNLSIDDQALLDVLKKKHDYTIVLPKTRTANFIEHSSDKEIQKRITEKNIIFTTVKFTVSKDNATRRYVAYEEIYNLDSKTNKTTYPNANIVLWKLSQGKELTVTQLKKFKEKDIIGNRIMIKRFIDNNMTNVAKIKSHWSNLEKYSVLHHYKTPYSNYSKAVVMLGTTYKGNGDSFEILSVFGNLNMFGVELQAQVLMTLFYFDGQLKKMSPFWTHFWVFYLVFMIDVMVSLLLLAFRKKESKWTLFFVLGLIVVVMGYLSYYLFLQQGIWFNWFVPTVLFQLIDIFF